MAAQEQHHLHHSYVWLGALRTVPYILVAIVASGGGSLIAEIMGESGAVLGYALLVIGCLVVTVFVTGIVLLVRYVSYRYIWYEFDTMEFSYYSGILSKKRVHVPYQKVQSVNEKASLLQRLVGVYTVRIETAGGADNKAVLVSYLNRAETERMRNELFLHKQLIDAGWSAEAIDAYFASPTQQSGPGVGVQAATSQAPVPPWVLEAQAQTGAGNGALPVSGTAQPGMVADVPLSGAPAGVSSVPGVNVPGASSVGATSYSAVPSMDNILDQPAAFVHDVRGVFGGAAIDTGRVSYEYGLTNKELIFAAISGKSSWSLAVIGVVSTLASLITFVFDSHIVSERQAELGAQILLTSLSPAPILFGFLASLLGFLLFIWVVLIAGSCLSYGGFKARRRGDRIEVEHGIITHVVHGMSIERIQSVKVHQTFFQRLLGYCSVSYGRVAAAADSSSDQSNSLEQSSLVVHPFLPLKQVNEVVSQLTPEYAIRPETPQRVAPIARRRAVTRRVIVQGFGFWMLVGVLVGWYGLQALVFSDGTMGLFEQQSFVDMGTLVVIALLVIALVVAVVEVIGALLWYRHSAFGYDERSLTLVNGGFSIDTITVPRNKIQMAYIKTNPLQRHAHVATIVAVDAAGSGSTERLIDVSVTDAEQWLAWVQPKGQQRV